MYLVRQQPTLLDRMVVGGSVLFFLPVCCRFAVHPNSYDYSFTVFAILLSQCVVNITLTTIGSCGESICRRDESSLEQFTPSCNGGSGAHPLQLLNKNSSGLSLTLFLVHFKKYFNAVLLMWDLFEYL